VIPTPYRAGLLELFHNSPFGGHLGIARTYGKIGRRYAWEGLYEDVERHVLNCAVCKEVKAKRVKANRWHPTMRDPTEPFDIIAIDYVGPFPASEGFLYILVIVDLFTGWAIAIPTMNATINTTMTVLQDFVSSQHGVPRILLSDGAFDKGYFKEMCARMKVQHMVTPPYRPQANGTVERFNGTLKTMLTAFCKEQANQWVNYVQAAVFAYNTSPLPRTQLSPFFALFGREARVPFEPVLNPAQEPKMGPSEMLNERYQVWQRSWRHIASELTKERLAQAEADRKHAVITYYAPGDRVWLKNQAQQIRGKTPLFLKRYLGPYSVTRHLGQVYYELEREGGRGSKIIVHVDDLKRTLDEPKDNDSTVARIERLHATDPRHVPELKDYDLDPDCFIVRTVTASLPAAIPHKVHPSRMTPLLASQAPGAKAPPSSARRVQPPREAAPKHSLGVDEEPFVRNFDYWRRASLPRRA